MMLWTLIQNVITGIDGKTSVKSYGKKVERKTHGPMISFCEGVREEE